MTAGAANLIGRFRNTAIVADSGKYRSREESLAMMMELNAPFANSASR